MPKKTTTPATKIPAVSQEQLRSLADYVLRESAAGEVRSTINIGLYLFSQLFRASEDAFRSKDPDKPNSLNALAAQAGMSDAGWSETRLRRAIEVSLMAKAHNDFRAWRFLRVSHYEVVIGMPAEKQRELLDRAQKERWSVARLGEEAGKKKPARPVQASPGSVSPDKALTRVRKAMGEIAALNAPSTALAPVLVQVGIDGDAAEEFTAQAEKLLGLLEGFQKQIEEMKKRSASKLKRVAGKLAVPG
ncbi:MAG TPA: hypothetical protein VGK67_17220 [Myxococcales bacterium]|jgi:hypothetical protein